MTAFTVCGLLQLACKHPSVSGDVKATAEELVHHISEGLGGPVLVVIRAGWHS
jgi:hypothetical protein